MQSGELTADLLDAPNDFRLNLDSSLDPAHSARVVSPSGCDRFLVNGNGRARPPFSLLFAEQSRARQAGTAMARWLFSGRVSAASG